MFKPENIGGKNNRDEVKAKINKFCKFSGEITELPDGNYQVISCDNSGRQNGVFKFSSSGEPIHFVALDTDYKIPSDEIIMAENKKRYPTGPLHDVGKMSRQKESI